ncbi:restriction endonuclease [Streptomyces sp. URMC 127]|uniref:restriction endonuclease n=1 Tax=Streptomyces sp. URMC 127 TaxID=3423402 RepID=UPI003F1A2D75
MHINWNTCVNLSPYEDEEMNAALLDKIRAATDDDLLAAFLHHAEGRVALETYQQFDKLCMQLEAERDHARRLSDYSETPLGLDFWHAHYRLHRSLKELLGQAEAAVDTAADVWRTLREATVHDDLSSRFRQQAPDSPSPLEEIGPLRHLLAPLQQQLKSVLDEHRARMHELALQEAELLAFAASNDSISLEQFDAMTPLELEQSTADLAERDGYTLLQRQGKAGDQGADVIALTPDGRKIVFQCKHRRRGKPVGAQDTHTLNGTARPEHNGDIVVLVTNSTFTKPARAFAAKHRIHLLHGELLQRWATWGVPLLTVLREDPADADATT